MANVTNLTIWKAHHHSMGADNPAFVADPAIPCWPYVIIRPRNAITHKSPHYRTVGTHNNTGIGFALSPQRKSAHAHATAGDRFAL